MKRNYSILVLLVALAFLVASCQPSQPTDDIPDTPVRSVAQLAQDDVLIWSEECNGRIVIIAPAVNCYDETEATPQPTPTTGATIAPTAVATVTTTPQPTPTPVSDPAVPYPDAPPCDDHDHTRFHTLWNYEIGCYYDHSHGVTDPSSLDHVFGTAAWDDWFDSGPLDFSWATSDHESHNDYVWLVDQADECYSQFSGGCFMAWRALVHNDFQNAVTRYHSYFIEALVCSEADPTRCGTFTMAGWHDTGDLVLDGQVVIDVDQSGNRAPRAVKLHYTDTGNSLFGTWYPVSPAGWSRISTEVGDMWGYYTDNGNENIDFTFFCDSPTDCERNGSRVQAHVLGFTVSNYLRNAFGFQADDDNRYNFYGYTDRYGFPAEPGCEVSIDCLPIHLSGVPAETQYQYRGGDYIEMDIYFNGRPSGWIAPPGVHGQ